MEAQAKQKLLIEEKIIAIVLAIMSTITFLNVIFRYILKAPLGFSEELVVNLFTWATMLGAAAACRRKVALGFGLMVSKTPAKVNKVIQVLVNFISLAFILFIVYNGFQMVISQIQFKVLTPIANMPEFIFGASIPVGAAFYAFRIVQDIVDLFKGEEKI